MRSMSWRTRHVSKNRAAVVTMAATAAVAVVAGATRPAMADPYIGVKFRGIFNDVSLDPGETTGVIPQNNWNHANGNGGGGLVLNDATGAPTAVTMSYSAQEAWGTFIDTSTSQNKLFAGYISSQDSLTSTISLGNVPLGFYDLVVYTMRDNNDGNGSIYGMSASGVVYRTTHQWRDDYYANPTFKQATSTDPNNKQIGNYVRWDGVPVVGNLDIAFTADTARAPVNGLQLATSTKPVKTWSGQVNGVWNVTTPNFSGQAFQNGDNLFFKDANGTGGAVVNRDVAIGTGAASPSGIIVDNSAGAYTLAGAIRSGGLVKAGSSDLTLGGAGGNDNLAISAITGGTVALGKTSSPDIHAVARIANVAAGATVRLAGTGGNQIADAGDVSNMNGTLDLSGRSERFGTLTGGGTVTTTAGMHSVLTIGSSTNGRFSGTIQNSADLTLVKEGAGLQGLNNTTFSGAVTINDGTFELSGNGQVGGPGITLYGNGARTRYPYGGGQIRQGALALTDLNVDPIGSTPVVLNGGEVIHNASGAIKDYTLQNVTAASGLNTFGNQPQSGARPLTLGSLTRTRGATVEFKSHFGTLGGSGDDGQVKVGNLNGAGAPGNVNGIMGGWAIAYNGDGSPWESYWATYDPATGAKPYGGTYVETLTGVGPTDNIRVTSPSTVSTNTTVNSLVARSDNAVSIDAGVTLKVDTGGVIITYGSSNQIGGGGNLTTGLASGELFVHVYDGAFDQNSDRFNLNAHVTDNAGTPTTLVKSGYGPLTLGTSNSYTGGTIVNSGTLTLRDSGAAGSGPITVAPGGQLALGQNAVIGNPLTLNGTAPNGALRSRAGGGGAQAYYSGTITLARTSNVGSTSSDDNLILSGKITGPGGLMVAAGKVVLGSNANDYAGDTTVAPGALLWAADPTSGGRIPSGAGKGNVIVQGTLDLAGLPQTINGLSGGGTITNAYFDSTTLTVGAGDASSTFAGVMKDGILGATIALAKTGAGTITLSGNNTHTGGTTVNAGTLVLANPDTTAGGAINVAGGTAQAQAALSKAVTVSTLTTSASGKFDLTDNSMVIKGMTAVQVRGLLASGFNAGHWNGPSGITSSTAAASTETSVGLATQAQLGVTEFKGVTGLSASDVLVKYTYAGDANLDGKVDIGDLGLLAGAWQQLSGKVWFDGDFTYDGAVNIGDLGLLAGNWQKGTAGNPSGPLMDFTTELAQFSAFDGVVIPEPASLSLLTLSGLALARRRRRQQQQQMTSPAARSF